MIYTGNRFTMYKLEPRTGSRRTVEGIRDHSRGRPHERSLSLSFCFSLCTSAVTQGFLLRKNER